MCGVERGSPRQAHLIKDEQIIEEVEDVGAGLVDGRDHRSPAARQLCATDMSQILPQKCLIFDSSG